MEHKVWSIIEKTKHTKEGQKIIENTYDAIFRIIRKSNNEDIQILRKSISGNLFVLMDIMDELIED